MLTRIPLLILIAIAVIACAGTRPSDQGELPAVEEGATPEMVLFRNTPGLKHYTRGALAYQEMDYRTALAELELAARWADKRAQFLLGAMYFNGDGVKQDRPRGWAWFQVAAERRYAEMVEMARTIDAALDERERERGLAILENEILPRFGDHVAVDRTARRMAQDAQRLRTGSRLGGRGNVDIHEPGVNARLSAPRSPERDESLSWDFHYLLRLEAERFGGVAATSVDIRDFEVVEADDRTR